MRSALLVVAVCAACSGARPLRGSEEETSDGHTGLTVDDSWPGCDVHVDGRPWLLGPHVEAPIAPGAHDIDCGTGSGSSFVVRRGTVFHFDYWGP